MNQKVRLLLLTLIVGLLMAIVPGSAFAATRAATTAPTLPMRAIRSPSSVASNRGTTLWPGWALSAGDYLLSSNSQFKMIMQGDGNLVLYGADRAKWDSNTWGHPGAWAVMQYDGNLVVYIGRNNYNKTPLWASNTGVHGAYAVMQDDGNFVLYASTAQPWATNTNMGCFYPSVKYNQKGNFFNVFSETLNAEVCFNGSSVWTIWTNHKFSGVPGWNDTELGRGVFWDPGRYGGALTIWSNDHDTFSVGPVTYNEDTFLRIWVKPNGQEYQYGGL